MNNALVAETIEACANEHEQWIMYGRMGNHQSLDKLKQSARAERFDNTRLNMRE
jgi:hypothetical protein